MLRRPEQGETRILPGLVVFDQAIVLPGRERIAHVLVESYRPVAGRAAFALHHAQVVHDVAAGGEEDSFVAQRREARAEREMKRRRPRGVDRELHDGGVGVRKRVLEHRPRAVVESPRSIERDLGRTEQLAHACSEGGIAGSRVFDVEERPAENRRSRGSSSVCPLP